MYYVVCKQSLKIPTKFMNYEHSMNAQIYRQRVHRAIISILLLTKSRLLILATFIRTHGYKHFPGHINYRTEKRHASYVFQKCRSKLFSETTSVNIPKLVIKHKIKKSCEINFTSQSCGLTISDYIAYVLRVEY